MTARPTIWRLLFLALELVLICDDQAIVLVVSTFIKLLTVVRRVSLQDALFLLIEHIRADIFITAQTKYALLNFLLVDPGIAGDHDRLSANLLVFLMDGRFVFNHAILGSVLLPRCTLLLMLRINLTIVLKRCVIVRFYFRHRCFWWLFTVIIKTHNLLSIIFTRWVI